MQTTTHSKSLVSGAMRSIRPRAIGWIVPLAGVTGLVASLLASATLWVLVINPVEVASATSTTEAAELVRFVYTAVVDVAHMLFAYL